MGDLRVVLTLMNADGELYERYLPNDEGQTTITQLARDRFKPFRSEESQVTDESKQLARFRKFRHPSRLPCRHFNRSRPHFIPDCAHLRIVLDPLCDGVTVEPPGPDTTGAASGERVVIPPHNRTQNSRHYIHLRPNDIIHFETHNLQIRYSLQDSQKASSHASMPPATPPVYEDVQVKSSDPRRPEDALPQRRAASDSETDGEGADPHRTTTPENATSPPSRPTATKEVKETPSHVRYDEDDAPFSTARDRPDQAGSNRTSPVNGMPSTEVEPTGAVASTTVARAGKRQAGSMKRSQQASLSNIQSFSEDDFPSTPNPLKKTYGKASRRNTPDKRGDGTEDDDSLDAVDQQDAVVSDRPTVPTTSQIMLPNGPAHEAAARSVSRKRKLELDEGEGKEVAPKMPKLSTEEEDDAQANGDADAADGDDAEDDAESKDIDAAAMQGEESDDDGPPQIEAGPRVSSGRLPHVARAEESDENIVAKPRKTTSRPTSSPEVVVRAQRGSKSASKTPAGTQRTPDSTATSSFSGKPPKIITSGMSPLTPAVLKFMKAQGSSTIASIASRRTNFVCVVKHDDNLLKTPKVLRSLALGKLVVTERWINESKDVGELLDPADFVHEEVAATMEVNRRKLFDGKVLYFTNALVKEYGSDNWQEMKELATEAGASSVESGTGGKGGKMTGRNSIIYFGLKDKPDPDATVLIQDYGRVVYGKDLIKEAIVSGELDLDDDKYKVAAGSTKKTGRR